MTHFLVKPLAALVIGAAVVMASVVAALADITGSYYAYGRNVDGSAYEGTVQIGANGDGSYAVNWTVGNSYSGIGTLVGQVLMVEWGDTHPAVYVVMPDGDLHGTWADGQGLEALSRTPR